MVLIMRMPFQSSLKLPVTPADLERRRRNLIVVASSILLIALMGALTYYSVPLYRLFCQATGLGGTTQVARAARGAVPGLAITVRFDANVASNFHGASTHPSLLKSVSVSNTRSNTRPSIWAMNPFSVWRSTT